MTNIYMTARARYWRRRYYDIFSLFYDRFIQLHARQDESGTRSFLADSAALSHFSAPLGLDICCGTGAVLVALASRYPQGIFVGFDFSLGMLRAAQKKHLIGEISFTQGNAANLPFADDTFHVVSCSHALYELKGADRTKALNEMKRVVRQDGVVLIMEHEPPSGALAAFMFRLRLKAMGSFDAKEFVESGIAPFQMIFPSVSLRHTPSGKSKLICCRKCQDARTQA
ncbi:MAG: methyltransferase domain-containing protein [Desulfosarcinaceae bacterium]